MSHIKLSRDCCYKSIYGSASLSPMSDSHLSPSSIICMIHRVSFVWVQVIQFLDWAKSVHDKHVIFVMQSHTTKIELYPWASGNLVIKSVEIWAHSFSSALSGISFHASVQFLFLWHASHPSKYFLTSLVTPGHQKFLVTNSVIFHCPPCSPTSISQCSWITSALSFLSLRTYTFPSLNITLSSSYYSSSLSTFTPTCFISSTAFTTLSSFASDLFIFYIRFTPSIITSSTCIALTSIHSFFIHTLSLLSLSTPTCQSGL